MREARDWLKSMPTIRPTQETLYPYPTIGKALNHRIRYYFQTDPPYYAWSGSFDLDDDPRSKALLPKRVRSVPVLFHQFSDSLGEVLERLSPVGRLLEQPEEELLSRYCILLALFQEWTLYDSYKSPLLFPTRHRSVSALLSVVKPHWVEDLCHLSWLFHKRYDYLLSRPAIFEASFEDTGWASADLIINNCVIEIKASIHPRLERQWLYQVVAYALLDHKNSYRLREAGIYMARQGCLLRCPLRDLLSVLHGGKISSLRKLRKKFQNICRNSALGLMDKRALS